MIEATPSLEFSKAINLAASRIFECKGRSRRSEFWWTQLLVYIATIALTPFVGSILRILTIPLTIRRLHDTGRSGWWWGFGALLKFAFVIYILYSIAKVALGGYDFTTIDEDFNNIPESEIFLVIKFVIGIIIIAIYDIVLLILCCIDSDKGENKYGPSPKYVAEENNSEI